MPRRRGKVAARISTLQRATRVARALTCDVALIASLGRPVIAPALKPDGRSGSTASRRVRPFPGSSGRSGQGDDARSRPAPKSRRMTEQRLRSTDFGLTLRSLEASPIDGPQAEAGATRPRISPCRRSSSTRSPTHRPSPPAGSRPAASRTQRVRDRAHPVASPSQGLPAEQAARNGGRC
jgi:hypothetical protein